jgi:ABC-2 type transport system permease protein
MVAIGAIASAEQESRQFAAVFIVLSVLPVSWGMPLFLEKPDSPVVAFLSLFPLTSPMSMMILIGVGEAETWQVALSLILLVITIAFVLWLAGRVFRIGLLLTGQRLSPRRLMKLLKG